MKKEIIVPQFVALTSKGLESVLTEELQAMNMKSIRKSSSCIFFETNWRGCYQANLKLRTATRIGLTVKDFPAYKAEDIYHNTLKHDFTKYITPEQTIAVDATVKESALGDQRSIALKVKDAIADQFRNKLGQRPNVDRRNPDLRVLIRGYKNQYGMSLDTSGVSLSKRGYRTKSVEAPLREHLAAALIHMAKWTPDMPLVDPFCGSGTILIEAALMASRIAPGSLQKMFAFQKWKIFQSETWGAVIDEVLSKEITPSDLKIFGSDISRDAVRAVRENAKRAGVEDMITFQRQNFMTLEPPASKGILIFNPPYGLRLEDPYRLIDLYKDIGFVLKQRFGGWKVFILSGDRELTRHLGLKSFQKIPVFNGNIECRLLCYEIRS